MKFNWVKIDSCDWRCELPNGDRLRVERMNRDWVWWCFYLNNESYHNYDLNSHQRTIKEAKAAVEKEYEKAAH